MEQDIWLLCKVLWNWYFYFHISHAFYNYPDLSELFQSKSIFGSIWLPPIAQHAYWHNQLEHAKLRTGVGTATIGRKFKIIFKNNYVSS